MTVRDGVVHAAAVGLCQRAGMGCERVHWVMLRWRRPFLLEAQPASCWGPGQIYDSANEMELEA